MLARWPQRNVRINALSLQLPTALRQAHTASSQLASTGDIDQTRQEADDLEDEAEFLDAVRNDRPNGTYTPSIPLAGVRRVSPRYTASRLPILEEAYQSAVQSSRELLKTKLKYGYNGSGDIGFDPGDLLHPAEYDAQNSNGYAQINYNNGADRGGVRPSKASSWEEQGLGAGGPSSRTGTQHEENASKQHDAQPQHPTIQLPPVPDFTAAIFKRGVSPPQLEFYTTLQTAQDLANLQTSSHQLNEREQEIFNDGPITINDFLGRIILLGVPIPNKYHLARLRASIHDPEIMMQALIDLDAATPRENGTIPMLQETVKYVLESLSSLVLDPKTTLSQRSKSQYLQILTGLPPPHLRTEANIPHNPSIYSLLSSIPVTEFQPTVLHRTYLFLLGQFSSSTTLLTAAYKDFKSQHEFNCLNLPRSLHTPSIYSPKSFNQNRLTPPTKQRSQTVYHLWSRYGRPEPVQIPTNPQRSPPSLAPKTKSLFHIWSKRGIFEVANSVIRNLIRVGHASDAWDFLYKEIESEDRGRKVERRTWEQLLVQPDGCREWIPEMKRPAMGMLVREMETLERSMGVKWTGGEGGYHAVKGKPFWVRKDTADAWDERDAEGGEDRQDAQKVTG